MRGNPEVNTDSSVNLMSEQAGLSLSGCVTPLPEKSAVKIARTFAETKRLTTRATIFMVGGAPTAHEF
jgi:hypothetical protein